MSLVLELPIELEAELKAEAADLGVPLNEYALALLTGTGVRHPVLRNGAELVAYWEQAGLFGSRPDITDPVAHTRQLRESAQRSEVQ